MIIYVGLESKDQPVVRFNPAPAGDARLPPTFCRPRTPLIRRPWLPYSGATPQKTTRRGMRSSTTQPHVPFKSASSSLQAVTSRSFDKCCTSRRTKSSGRSPPRSWLMRQTNRVWFRILFAATRDPSPDVRNNAVRALGVFTRMSPSSSRAAIRIPYEPFIELLSSPVWTDRNKASLAVMQLTDGRDPVLLAALKRAALTPLIEMARWKSEGHAMPALTILGRIAGESDESVKVAWDRGERERVIQAAIGRR